MRLEVHKAGFLPRPIVIALPDGDGAVLIEAGIPLPAESKFPWRASGDKAAVALQQGESTLGTEPLELGVFLARRVTVRVVLTDFTLCVVASAAGAAAGASASVSAAGGLAGSLGSGVSATIGAGSDVTGVASCASAGVARKAVAAAIAARPERFIRCMFIMANQPVAGPGSAIVSDETRRIVR